MDWGTAAVVLGVVFGTGGLAGVISTWRKSRSEATDIGVGTQERIFAMANSVIDQLRMEREECYQRLANHEARIRQLENRLRDYGLPWNGGSP